MGGDERFGGCIRHRPGKAARLSSSRAAPTASCVPFRRAPQPVYPHPAGGDPAGLAVALLGTIAVNTLLRGPLAMLAKLPIDVGSLVVSGTKIMMQQPKSPASPVTTGATT